MEQVYRIGLDHGYGNIKTAHHVFQSGVIQLDTPPTYGQNVLEYDSHYYLIGDTHKEFIAEKIWDEDYYVLSLAAIAMELKDRGMCNASVILATGLPIKWLRKQRESFKNYLNKNKNVTFKFNGIRYSITIQDVEVYPQGFSAVAEKLADFKGVNILSDIGNGTMNILFIIDGVPSESKSYTEKFGVSQCILEMKNELMNQFGTQVDDSIIEAVIRDGTADIGEKYLKAISAAASVYADKIMRKLREYGYHEELTKLHFSGGGAILMKHFGNLDPSKVNMIKDICATAKGYEYMSNQMKMKRQRSHL